jgi:hypothetical protein
LASFVAGGCGEQVDGPAAAQAGTPTDSVAQSGLCCWYGYPNGTGINIAENPSGPANQFGIPVSGFGQWYLTGFQNPTSSSGTVTAVGWYGIGNTTTATSANGKVTYANYGGVWYPLLSITGGGGTSYFSGTESPNYPVIWINDPNYGATPLYGRFLNGVLLYVTAPDGRHTYDLMLSATNQLPSQQDPSGQGQILNGLMITVSVHGANTYSPFCNVGGVNESALIYQGSTYDPMTAARTDASTSVTLTCQSGGIAKCMSWGYTNWDSTGVFKDNTMLDTHQSCIQLKRAAYYGDGQAFTISGTLINKKDALQTPIWNDDMTKLEALWDSKGALCVNSANRRHPELPGFIVGKLPECDAKSWTLNWLTASALP